VLKLLELRGAGAPLLVDRRTCVTFWRVQRSVSEDEAKRKCSACGTYRKRSELRRTRRLNSTTARLLGVEIWDGSIRRYRAGFERVFAELKAMDVSPARQDSVRMHLHQVLERRTRNVSSASGIEARNGSP